MCCRRSVCLFLAVIVCVCCISGSASASLADDYDISNDAAWWQLPLYDIAISPYATTPAASSTVAASSLVTDSIVYHNPGNVNMFGVYGYMIIRIVTGTTTQTVSTPYVTAFNYSAPSSTGLVRTLTGSGSYNWNTSGNTSYNLTGYWAVKTPLDYDNTSTITDMLDADFYLKLPSGVYSYQLSGSVVVTTTLAGQSSSVTIPCSQDIFTSIDEITRCKIPLTIPYKFVSATALSGTVSSTITIDLSGLNIYLNQTSETVLMTLPSGQYLTASGSRISGTNVPAYTYLTQGLLGLSSNLMGTSGSVAWQVYLRGRTEPYNRTATSLGQMLSFIEQDLSSNMVLSGNTSFLSSSGSSTSNAAYQSSPMLLANGFLGLSSNMMGPTGSLSFFVSDSSQPGSTKTYTSIGSMFGSFMSMYSRRSIYDAGVKLLLEDGTVGSNSYATGSQTGMMQSMIGLAAILRGPSGTEYPSTLWIFGEDLNKVETQVTYTNLLQALSGIQTSIQNPLSQLQAVLANDEDLALRQRVADEVDQVVDDFTGGGQGAPGVSDIGDMAGVSGGVNELFDTGVSASDFFTAANDSDTYNFFSQEVANDLDNSSMVATYIYTNPFYYLEMDDDGYYHVADMSPFSVESFLGGGEQK